MKLENFFKRSYIIVWPFLFDYFKALPLQPSIKIKMDHLL